MIYNITAMVVYSDQIEAETEEDALDKFMDECPYSTISTQISMLRG